MTPQGIYSLTFICPVPSFPRVGTARWLCVCTHQQKQSYKITISDLRLHPHKIIFNNVPRHNTNVQMWPQSHQPTHRVLQPQASYTQGLQLRSEDSSLPLNHATLILRTCRLAAFYFMQLHLKAVLISVRLKSQLGKHFAPAARWWWSSSSNAAWNHRTVVVACTVHKAWCIEKN